MIRMAEQQLIHTDDIPAHVFRYVEKELYDYPIHRAALYAGKQEQEEILRRQGRQWPPPEGRAEDGPAQDVTADTYMQLESLDVRLTRARRNINRIEPVFDVLSLGEQKLVRAKYWDRNTLSNDVVAKDLGMGRTRFYEMRYEIVRKFAVGFGLI